MKRHPKLSARAKALLNRLKQGRCYLLHSSKVPKAMQELVEFKLVRVAARPIVIAACYIPMRGFRPYKPERLTNPHEAKS